MAGTTPSRHAPARETWLDSLTLHLVDGRLANDTDAALFCSGCNLQALYVIGYRLALAGEPF